MQVIKMNIFNQWEVYVRDSLANDHNICKNITECFESYLRITKPTLDV